MAKIDSLEIELISEEEIEKLEKAKKLLAEIKQLKEEVFGKQKNGELIKELIKEGEKCGKPPLLGI